MSLLQELTFDVDPSDPNAVAGLKQKVTRAKNNPNRASREATLNARDELKTAQNSEPSPLKSMDVRIAKLKQQLSMLYQQRTQLAKRVEAHYIVTDSNGEVLHEGKLTEAATAAYKRAGNVIKRQFRCTSGKKEGKIVAEPNACNKKKNPKSVRAGKKSARKNKGVRINKTRISKNTSISKMVTRLNQR